MTIINAQLGGDPHEDFPHPKPWRWGLSKWSWDSDRIGIHLVFNFNDQEGSISFVFTLRKRCDVPMRMGKPEAVFQGKNQAFRQLCTPGQEGSTMVPTVRVTTARTVMEPLAA